jgi:FdrA protein
MAMDALDADAGTEAIVLISKPPHPDVAREVIGRIAASTKPHVVCFIGADDLELPPNARQAHTLREAAELAMGASASAPSSTLPAGPRAAGNVRPGCRIEGLFSAAPLRPRPRSCSRRADDGSCPMPPFRGCAGWRTTRREGADRIIDLGADEYTRGRPHPMIDPGVRDDMLRAALADPAVAVVLVDLVIGYGAHDDPAGHLAQVLGRPSAGAPVIASVTGTRLDPQNLAAQAARLSQAGVIVAPSNAHACELALAIARGRR